MSNFREKLIRFFSGRYGLDDLNRFLFWVYIASVVLMTVVELFVRSWITFGLRALFFLVAVFMIYRAMSRKIYVRQNENRKFLSLKTGIRDQIRLFKSRIRDRKTHVYRKCPDCKAVLRLKRIAGRHRAACPRCGKSFDVFVR